MDKKSSFITSSSSNQVSDKIFGIDQLSIANLQLTIYPNPTNSLSVVSYQLLENTEVSIKLYDLTGREIRTLADEKEFTGKHSLEVNMSNLDKGVYFVKVTIGDNLITRKITKI